MMVILSIYSVLRYKGERREFYDVLLLLLIFLVGFQYAIYNHTLLFIYYKYPVADIWNYPVFFDVIEIFIYSIFFSEFISLLTVELKKSAINNHLIQKRISNYKSPFLTFFIIFLLIFSIIPIIEYTSNAQRNIDSNGGYLIPPYWNEISYDLKNYQNYKVLILPNNQSTLQLLDSAIPYYHVYGLPYNYKVFASLFPNESLVVKLFNSFRDGNISELSHLLVSQGIGLIIVLNPTTRKNIVAQGVYISGGGKNFANLINETRNYNETAKTANYIVYKIGNTQITTNSSGYQTHLNPSLIGQKTLNFTSTDKLLITTGNYSHIQIPMNVWLPHNIAPNTSLGYQQEIFVPHNLSSQINQNFSNVMFQYGNGSYIPA